MPRLHLSSLNSIINYSVAASSSAPSSKAQRHLHHAAPRRSALRSALRPAGCTVMAAALCIPRPAMYIIASVYITAHTGHHSTLCPHSYWREQAAKLAFIWPLLTPEQRSQQAQRTATWQQLHLLLRALLLVYLLGLASLLGYVAAFAHQHSCSEAGGHVCPAR